ncbi:hypothetical protein EWB00_009687 [Schistosoma japonicum]|uniref:Uncharacterized protein n=1 Tax=Schistosoma japonicum TaxID=6182 RepID=A0A4Z2DR38_SCHJA|nr:hypothetical protein EWB00_009687 [Schistosoma japonicum]
MTHNQTVHSTYQTTSQRPHRLVPSYSAARNPHRFTPTLAILHREDPYLGENTSSSRRGPRRSYNGSSPPLTEIQSPQSNKHVYLGPPNRTSGDYEPLPDAPH